MPVKSSSILVFRGGAIGDFVLTTPVFYALREAQPRARLTLFCHPRMSALALACGLADSTESVEKMEVSRLFARGTDQGTEWRAFIRSFDAVISFLHDPDGIVRENLLRAGAKHVVFSSPLVSSGHAADWLMQSLAGLGISGTAPAAPSLRLPGDHVARGMARLRSLAGSNGSRAVAAIHPGSGSARKNWPADQFAALARRLRDECGLFPVFILGEADSAAAEALAAVAPKTSLVAGLDLLEVASLLASCRCYVGNDSGITHLAAALGIPVVALFGPTDPAGWGPRGPNVRIVRAPGPATGSMAGIEPGLVFDAVGQLFREAAKESARRSRKVC